MTIVARYDGAGILRDPDDATDTNEDIPSGGTFTTTKKRLGELKAQGVNVAEVPKAEAAKLAEAATASGEVSS